VATKVRPGPLPLEHRSVLPKREHFERRVGATAEVDAGGGTDENE
jgi:hypothetical protein